MILKKRKAYLADIKRKTDSVREDRKMAIAHESVKGRNINSDEMWELSPHHVHNKYIKRKTDSVYCSTSLSVFHSLLIFFEEIEKSLKYLSCTHE